MKTLIIDGNNLIHRTYWTAKTQSKRINSDSTDQISNFHIYFTLNAILSYVNKYKPSRTIMVWDEKPDYKQNTRKSEFAGYKGNRTSDSTPHQNNETIKRMLNYLGVNSIFPRELEADDIVAYICKNHEGKKVIVSVDRDFLQLVSSDVILFDPIRKKEFVIDTFEEDTGWAKETWLIAKCLKGDKSDNVPGIERFGDKKIKKFLNKEIKLTEEQLDIYNRNLSLFSLDAFKNNEKEQNYYKTQLDTTINTNWNKFIEECKEREFNAIIKKQETWYSLFIMSNKLESLLG